MLPNKPHFFRLEILETIFGITILCRTHLFLEKNAMCMHWIFLHCMHAETNFYPDKDSYGTMDINLPKPKRGQLGT